MWGAAYFGKQYFGAAYWGPGLSIPPTPTPTPDRIPGAGKGGKRRRYIQLKNGERREVYSDRDLYEFTRELIEARAEKPLKKVNKKRKKTKPVNNTAGLLQNFASWDTLYTELAAIELIDERFLWDLLLAIMVREQIKDDDEEVMLILEMMQ